MARYAIYVDVSRCTGCHACVVGCNNCHGDEWERIRIVDKITGRYPDAERWVFPVMCMHCEDAPCVKICPEEAIHKRDDGIVWVDEDRCIGCGECIDVCPYGVISLDEEEGKAKKCDLCMKRIDKGLNPFCVEVCPTDALIFGDLNDSESRISSLLKSKKAMALLPGKTKGGNVFYTPLPELNEIMKQED